MTIKVDVFVSGLGPVGLFFANQMVSRGHSVYCLDPKSGPAQQSRALQLTSRSMEILEARGFGAEFLANAFVPSGICVYRNGTFASHVDMNGDSRFPHLTAVAQGTTEHIFDSRLREQSPDSVHYNTKLISYTQDDTGITAIVRNMATEEEHEVRATCIVGADGTHSAVRRGDPGWTYEGAALGTKFILSDLVVKNADHMRDKAHVFMNGSSLMGFFPLNPVHPQENDHRVFRMAGNLEGYRRDDPNHDEPTHGLSKETPPTIEQLQEWADRVSAPLKFEIDSLVWSTYFKVNERVANGFRRKRAFLIGDAAHCHSPMGGQGLNLGLQDADNLAWKMSDVLKGHAADYEKLLDSYNDERYPIVERIVEATSKVTQNAFLGSEFVGHIRSFFVTSALLVPQVGQSVLRSMMGHKLMVTAESPIMGASDKTLPPTGTFIPDTCTLRRSILPTGVHQKIERLPLRDLMFEPSPNYTAILIATCFARNAPNYNLVEKFWKDTRGFPIKRLVIQSVWHYHFIKEYPKYVHEEEKEEAQNSFYCEERPELPNSVTNQVGLLPYLGNSVLTKTNEKVPSVLVLVRPDLYIAQAKLVYNVDDLDDALKLVYDTYKPST